MTLATSRPAVYTRVTANMLVDPEAPHPDGGASGPFSERRAACAGDTSQDWVPDRETPAVPTPILARCLGCQDRLGCLLRAVESGSEGYWAGTTTANRAQLAATGDLTLERADQLQAMARRKADQASIRDRAIAKHPIGEGSLRAYRRGGCRCSECRRFNAQRRAAERAGGDHRPMRGCRNTSVQPVAAFTGLNG